MDEETEYRVKRVLEGEIQEYSPIVKPFQKPLLVYCRRLLGSCAEAEEAGSGRSGQGL